MPATVRWAVVAAEMAILWWLSSRAPLVHFSSTAGSMLHNVAHVVAYAGLAVATSIAVGGPRPLLPRPFALAVALAALYGAVDELHQSCVPGRVASWSDFGSDAFGACLGASAVQYVWTRRARWLLAALAALAMGLGTAAVATFADG